MAYSVTDRRIRRTREALHSALVDLTRNRSFDKVTVADISDRAMVNRATFYRHYRDKYDIVAEFFKSNIELLNGDASDDDDGILSEPQMLHIWVGLFEHFAANKSLYRPFLQRSNSRWLKDLIRQSYSVPLHGGLRTMRPSNNRCCIPEDLAVMLAIDVLLSTVSWWLEQETDFYPPAEMAQAYLRFLAYGYVGHSREHKRQLLQSSDSNVG